MTMMMMQLLTLKNIITKDNWRYLLTETFSMEAVTFNEALGQQNGAQQIPTKNLLRNKI